MLLTGHQGLPPASEARDLLLMSFSSSFNNSTEAHRIGTGERRGKALKEDIGKRGREGERSSKQYGWGVLELIHTRTLAQN